MNQPLITDWINAIASIIGIPLVLISILKIISKDKDKERKIVSLENIAISQDELIKKMSEQINELQNQTSEFQYQSTLMRDSNEIVNKQIELQNLIFNHNVDIEDKKMEIQKQTHLNEIKPNFSRGPSSRDSRKIEINLTNKGQTARKLRIEHIEDNVQFETLDIEREYDNEKSLKLKGTFNHISEEYKIDLLFEDVEGNQYKQRLTNKKIDRPILITN